MRSLVKIAALAVMIASAAPALAEIGRVKSNVGAASVNRSGRTVAVAPGVQLEPGDILVTGRDGRLGVTFVDGTRFAVGPNSRVTLTEFQFDRTRQSGSFVTSVDRGSLGVVSGSIAKSRRDAMRVRTPTSMLGVRGTRFVVDVP
ncbi:FecR domain-containing protein [Novosphingobium sp. G106]|uniref:FecR family protein n=1 Tax=Novosphingobium sp. G106 TaxID=2849500 RepID=UPI0020C47DCD|nr:FecR domain-containing protein [Novosphingobium sp. G106]